MVIGLTRPDLRGHISEPSERSLRSMDELFVS